MPASKNAFRRYLIIDSLLRRKNSYPSLIKLAEECEVSTATIKNDLSWMKLSPWNCPILYSVKHNGYYYSEQTFSLPALNLTKEDTTALKTIDTFLSPYRELSIYGRFKELMKEIESYSAPQSSNQKSSISLSPVYGAGKNIDILIKAIESGQKVRFDYINEWSDKSNSRLIHPYFLKEFKNNWFLIGLDEPTRELRTFFVEKMQGLTSINEYFSKEDFDEEKLHKYSLGVFSSNKMKPERLVLKCSNYALPQLKRDFQRIDLKVKKKTKKDSVIEFDLLITEDLDELLLSYSIYVEVLKPEWYREKFVNIVKGILKNYKT